MRAPVSRAVALAAIAVLGTLALSCLGAGDFRCGEHRQCGAGAFCEIDGRCSVPAKECPSRRRYVRNAGAASDACVAESCANNPVATLSAGGLHACAVRADGSVQCWGANDDGQLGDGTRTTRAQPVGVLDLDDARAVTAGQRHSCAVRLDGRVACWGANEAGQLGNGIGASSPTPVTVAGISDAVSVAAGEDFSCAVLSDGTALCWGADDLGQLGDGGAAAATHLPSPVLNLTGIRSVSASWRHACAFRDNETLWCWGANGQGQVGDGSTTNQPRPVRVPMLSQVTAVGAGATHTCAVTRSAGLYCWGSNLAGELGTTAQGPITTPLQVPIVVDPIAVTAGLQQTCAIRFRSNPGTVKSGAVYCWGQNDRGQLGQAEPLGQEMTPLSSPAPVPGMDTATAVAMDTATAVAAGAAFSCALMLDGAVFCWGDNHHGQLATGSGTLSALPAPVPSVTNATAIAAGGAHTCATIDAGSGTAAAKPVCWGADQAGQLGDAKAVDRAQPRPIQAEVRASAIAAGGAHSCALDGTTVWCWGRGTDGQLGSGALADKSPTPVATLPAVTAVSAGASHTCTIAAERVRCFGANGSGQLGDGTTTNRSEPAVAPLGADPATPARIAAGGAHTCAVDTDGHVWCWGNGEEGAVGDGSSMNRPAPVAIRLGSDGATAQAIAAGGAHTCAVTTAGQLYCWGRGDEGQLGAGDTVDALDPTLVPTISGVVDVAAGGAHTCAIVGTERAVWCWGANDAGQLGNGMTEVGPTETPTPVAGLTGAQALSAGAAHTCALRSDRTVWCWGTDSSGQLGDGVPLYVNTPQLARLACR